MSSCIAVAGKESLHCVDIQVAIRRQAQSDDMRTEGCLCSACPSLLFCLVTSLARLSFTILHAQPATQLFPSLILGLLHL